jgi:sugar phosphate isomerase/epimerase
MNFSRRRLLKQVPLAGIAALASSGCSKESGETAPWLKISLQQYSFNGMFKRGELDPLDYPKLAVEKCGISALEYYNGFIMEKVNDTAWFADLKKRCDDLGVENQLMLLKNDRALDDADAAIRKGAATDYQPWLENCKALGCHSVRVDVRSAGDSAEVMKQALDGLNQLCDIAKPIGIDIIVENHGNHSSNGKWVADLMTTLNRDNCGTLPDFGNFKDYDKYQGVKDMLPWARAICAKVHHIEEDGSAKDTDFTKMLNIVKDGGFKGYIGIEFEGKSDPVAGILGTKKLIEKTLVEIG